MNNPWEEINTPKHDILSKRVNADHPLNLFWGRDSYGRFLFIYEYSTPNILPDNLPDLKGIQVHLLTPEQADTEEYMLILILKDKSDWHIFLSLCNDIVSATAEFEKINQATSIILRRLKRWQEFLQKAKSELLPEKTIKGLIGELLFLQKHLCKHYGIGAAVQFWQGPEDMPQDFNVENTAIEVKCQLGTTIPHIRISSANQLCSQLPEMYLYVVTLGKADQEADGAINLPVLINEIRQLLEIEAPSEFEHFNNLLYMTGYIDSDEYKKFSYIHVSEQMFSVGDEFPRLCPDQLPNGIEKITYDVNLLECEPFTATPEWMNIS